MKGKLLLIKGYANFSQLLPTFRGQPPLSGHLPLPQGLSLNSLSPNNQIRILKTDLHTFP